jgi:probable poly-beta-1,6-N-acetyl-D-glucosamine export protein
MIVAGHSYGAWTIDTVWEKTLANLITGGTALFVFISGFFFHHVFYRNFQYGAFLEKKYKFVFQPYLILSLLGLCFFVVTAEPLPYNNELAIGDPQGWGQWLRAIAIYLWTGKLATPYWYIPFILIMFLLSPFFVLYIRLAASVRIAACLLLLCVAVLIHRPQENLYPLRSVLYFIPVYLLGILSSIHHEQVARALRGKTGLLGVAVLSLALFQAFFYEGYGNFHKEKMFVYGGVDILLIQKVVMCFFLLSWLQHYEHRHLPVLKMLASTSFAVFFIHPWVLFALSASGLRALLDLLPGLIGFGVTFCLVLWVSVLTAYLIKASLKDRSRYLTGW